MWKKNNDFSKEELSRLLNSPEAMALAAMLQKMDPSTLNQAAAAATGGDGEKAKQLLSPLMQDPAVQKLLKGMGGNHGGV